jgi:hypothetical protein
MNRLFMNNSAAGANTPGAFPNNFLERPALYAQRTSFSEEAEATARTVTMDRTWWCPFCDCCLSYPESASFIHARPRSYAPFPSLYHSHPPQKMWGRQSLCSTHLRVSAILAARAAIQGQHQRVRRVDSIGSGRAHVPTRRQV